MKGALLYQLQRKGRKALFTEATWRLTIGCQQHFGTSFKRTCLGRIADSALHVKSENFSSGALDPWFASQQACMASAPEVLSDCPAAKKDQSAARKEAFLEVYKQLKNELLSDSKLFSYTADSRAWLEKMLDYNVPGGKLNRGLSVVDSFMLLKRGKEISKDELLLASILGWCIEWMQAYFLVSDDIMDNSITRRGQPCWFRIPKVGMIAVNDGIVLRNQYIQILRTHFGNKSYYTELLRLFNEVEYQTAFGQTLDVILTPAGEVDLDKYVPETYFRIVQYKTAYYSFYLPVSCALYLAGERSSEVFESAKAILVEMGTYFQVQDDYLDCFGTPELIGKIGTDIEDAKCSWLIVQALQHANIEQKAILKDNYGKADSSHVSKVKEIYSELNVQKRFAEYEQESYSKLVCSIEKQGDPALQDVLKSFLLKIYRRQK